MLVIDIFFLTNMNVMEKQSLIAYSVRSIEKI